jgi:hypothetical protein
MTIMSPIWEERLRRSFAEAAARLARSEGRLSGRTGPPAPGDLYVFALEGYVAPEWLVVRDHPDDGDLLFLVPVDGFPLAGTPDVELAEEAGGRPLTPRCGQGLWLPSRHLPARLRVDALPGDALRPVRQKMAELARGRLKATERQRQADADPEYQEWIAAVEQVRQQLEVLASQEDEVIRFWGMSVQPPAELAGRPTRDLAAAAGDDLTAALDQAVAGAADAVRYHEIPFGDKGKLFLLADDAGISAVWSGPFGDAPALSGQLKVGELVTAGWQAGPEGKLHLASPSFPWIDGRAALTVGAASPQKVVIQR